MLSFLHQRCCFHPCLEYIYSYFTKKTLSSASTKLLSVDINGFLGENNVLSFKNGFSGQQFLNADFLSLDFLKLHDLLDLNLHNVKSII